MSHRSLPSARIPRWLQVLAVLGLAQGASAQLGTVRGYQKIGQGSGGFVGPLDPGDGFSVAVASLGDLDGDGIHDLAVGAEADSEDDIRQGSVWILFLNADGSVRAEQRIGEGSGGFEGVLDRSDFFGASIATLGDLDGDGTQDIAVGAYGDSDGAPAAGNGFNGAVWILFLNPDGTVKAEQKISELAGNFSENLDDGSFDGYFFGAAVAALGDHDGDGHPDLAVGTPRDGHGSDTGFHGAVWVLFLNPDGTVKQKRKVFVSGTTFDQFGNSVAPLGDLDQDGIGDLAVGAWYTNVGLQPLGGAWILFLNADGSLKHRQKITEGVGGFSGDLGSNDLFGASVTAAGDLDGDGHTELAVGARDDDDGPGFQAGAVWMLFLNADGTVKDWQKISAEVGWPESPIDDGDGFGTALALLGNLDGAGGPELAAGAPRDDASGLVLGAVWILSLEDCLRLDFETEDDFTTPLVNGQDLSTPPELGNLVALSSSGPNAGAALFDSTPGGPNDPSQDRDLLVDRGNVLILQTTDNTTQSVPGRFDRPNDDEDGGVLTFVFTAAVEPQSLDVIDIDDEPGEESFVVLTDKGGRVRVFTLPPDWTGDILAGGVGRLTLDLTTLAPQPGFGSTATALEDAGFRADAVLRLEVALGSSGAIDELCWRPAFPRLHGGPRAQPSSGAGLPTRSRSR